MKTLTILSVLRTTTLVVVGWCFVLLLQTKGTLGQNIPASLTNAFPAPDSPLSTEDPSSSSSLSSLSAQVHNLDNQIQSMQTAIHTEQAFTRLRVHTYNSYQSLIQCISLYELIPVMNNISMVRLSPHGKSFGTGTSLLSSPSNAHDRIEEDTTTKPTGITDIPSSFISRRYEAIHQMQLRTTSHLLQLIINARSNAIKNNYFLLNDTGVILQTFNSRNNQQQPTNPKYEDTLADINGPIPYVLPSIPGMNIVPYLAQLHHTYTTNNMENNNKNYKNYEGIDTIIIHNFEEILYHKYPHIRKDIIHLLLHLQAPLSNATDESDKEYVLSSQQAPPPRVSYGTIPFEQGLRILLHKQQQLNQDIPQEANEEANDAVPSAIPVPSASSEPTPSVISIPSSTHNNHRIPIDEILKLTESLIQQNNQIHLSFSEENLTFENHLKVNTGGIRDKDDINTDGNVQYQVFAVNVTDTSVNVENLQQLIDFIQTNVQTTADSSSTDAVTSSSSSDTDTSDTESSSSTDSTDTDVSSTPTPSPSPSPSFAPEYPEIPPGVDTPLAVNNLLHYLHVPVITDTSSYYSYDSLVTVPSKEEAKEHHQQIYHRAKETVINPLDYSVGDYVRKETIPFSSGNRLSSSPFSRFKRSVFQLNRTEIVLARSKREQDRLRLQYLGLPIAQSMVPHTAEYSSNIEFAMGEALRRSFEHAWYAYTKAGYGTDIYHPLSNTTGGDLCKMGETLIDGLDTALLMGLAEPYETAKHWTKTILPTLIGGQKDINLFECTIRIVGGLLSVYDLSHDTVFLEGAVQVMDAMIATGTFSSPTGLPYGTLYLVPRIDDPVTHQRIINTAEEVPDFQGIGVKTTGGYAYNPQWADGTASISEVSTLQVELAALSYHTGIDTYHKLGQRIMYHLYNKSTYDGLYPFLIDPNSGLLKDVPVTLGARADSLYEYMLKQWLYAGGWSYEEERAPVLADLVTQLLMPIWEKERYCIYWNLTENNLENNIDPTENIPEDDNAETDEDAAETDNDSETNDNEPIVITKIDIITPPEWIIPPIPDADPTFAYQRVEQAQRVLEYLQQTNENNPRYLLKMYNKAVRGIMDRLLQYSTPSNYTYVAESKHTINTMPEGQDPPLIPKMDHLVCFLPGVLGLGIQYDVGHENLAKYKEITIRTLAVIHALDAYQNRTERFWFTDTVTDTPINTERNDTDAEETEENDINTTIPLEYMFVFEKMLPRRYNTSIARALIVRILYSIDYVIVDTNRGHTIAQAIESSNFYQHNMRNTSVCPDILATLQPVTATTPTSTSTATPTADDSVSSSASSSSEATETTTDTSSSSTESSESSPSPSPSPSDTSTPVTNPLPSAFYRSFFPDPVLDPFGALTNPFIAKEQLLETAKGLTNTCRLMYSRTTTGLAPEIITFTPDYDFNPNHDARHCLLRPETVESLFIMYRITNDTVYQDWAWEIYDSIELHARVRTGGYASVKDVDVAGLEPNEGIVSAGKANMNDKMESFFIAETLKYLYLLFTPHSDQLLSLHDYVFNTEAHPLRIPKQENSERKFPTQWWQTKQAHG